MQGCGVGVEGIAYLWPDYLFFITDIFVTHRHTQTSRETDRQTSNGKNIVALFATLRRGMIKSSFTERAASGPGSERVTRASQRRRSGGQTLDAPWPPHLRPPTPEARR